MMLAGVVALAGFALAQDPPAGQDEPPVRLKKKKPRGDEKPMTEPAKPDEKKNDDKKDAKKKDQAKEGPREAEPVTPQEEEKEVLQRVVKNVHDVGERLAKADLGEATRQTQRDILKDIESLIHRNEAPPPQSGEQDQNQGGGGGGDDQNPMDKNQQGGGGGGGGQKSQRNQGGGGQKSQGNAGGGGQTSQGGAGNRGGAGGAKNQGNAGGGRNSGTQPGGGSSTSGQKPGAQKPGAGNPKDGTGGRGGDKPGGRNGKGGNGGEGGDKGERDMNRNADLYKDVWGHLPETLRAQMDAYSNPQPFLPKYDDLIRRYYRTIAEQGRRKGE
jgi:hypothetical protein